VVLRAYRSVQFVAGIAVAVAVGGLAAAAPAAAGEAALVARVFPHRLSGLDDSLLLDAGLATKGSVAARVPHVPRDRAGRAVVYVEGADTPAMTEAVRAVQGVPLGSVPGRLRAAVPPQKLSELAHAPGVREVRRPDLAVSAPTATNAVPSGGIQPNKGQIVSEGVAASGADQWIAADKRGGGVKVGVIDMSFAGLDAAQLSGELPPNGAGVTVSDSCQNQDPSLYNGTATAEVMHDMAPQAELFLACAQDAVGFHVAYDWLHSQGVTVYDSSIGFLTTGRGDGLAREPGDPQDTVNTSRRSFHEFWVAAAGDQAQTHLSGIPRDADDNGFVELSGTAERSAFTVAPHGSASVALRWDAWSPVFNAASASVVPQRFVPQDLNIWVMKGPNDVPSGSGDPNVVAFSTRDQASFLADTPTEQTFTFENNSDEPTTYYAMVQTNGLGLSPYDLIVSGDASMMDFADPAGSVLDPATSPYVVAVGATKAGSGLVEPYSAQGRTVDGRVKPDLTGFDQVSTLTTLFTDVGGQLRTAGAAAHAAGAAALLLGDNPDLDASVLQAMLQDQAGTMSAAPEARGHGRLALVGSDADPLHPKILDPAKKPQAPAGDPFTPLPVPQRILPSTVLGGTAPAMVTVPLPPSVPADAHAVAVGVGGFSATASTHLQVSAEGDDYGPVSMLNLPVRENRQFTAIVRVGHDHAIRVRNAAGSVNAYLDLFGYFGPGGTSTYVPRQVPLRILDSRLNVGGNFGATNGLLKRGTAYAMPLIGAGSVAPEIPNDATAVVGNLTVLNNEATTIGDSDVRVYPKDYGGTGGCPAAANKKRVCQVIVGIGDDGKIRLQNAALNSTGPGDVHATFDLVGWFIKGAGGLKYVPLQYQTRFLDTRLDDEFDGVRGGSSRSVDVAGINGIPAGPATVASGVVGLGGTADGWLTATDAALPRPPAVVNVDVESGEVTANGMVTPVTSGSGPTDLFLNSGFSNNVDVLVDVYGYFTPSPVDVSPVNAAYQASMGTDAGTTCANQGTDKAVNGSWAAGLDDKFCTNGTPKTLIVDLGCPRKITSVLLAHAGAGGETTAWNTRDYDLQVSDDHAAWTTVAQIRGNTASITWHPLAVSARFVRLVVLKPTQTTDTAARIYEFEVFTDS
jgi:hypothetical protein